MKSDKQNDGGGSKTEAFFARVIGRVQGVGYRYFAIKEAERLNIGGWARNTYDGEVEVWAEGSKEKLEIFLARLKQGPHYSHVVSVIHEERIPEGYLGFDVKY